MMRFMKWVTILFALLYAVALLLLAIGTFGWFGQERDPLSAVFLIPLGLPWNQFAEGWLVVVLAPAVNLGLLAILAGLIARRAAPRT